MIRPNRSLRTTVLLLALALPAPTFALAPVLVLLAKQLAQDSLTTMLKDTLLSSLNGMGCKGIALSNALEALDRRGGGGMTNLLAGMAGVTGMGGMGGLPGMSGTQGVPPEMLARMNAMMAPGIPAGGMGLDAEQTAMLGRMQQSMSKPLSVDETKATVKEMGELGLMPPAVQAEIVQCMVLLPQTVPALASAMGMMQPVLPQLRLARDQLHALSPAEQAEFAELLAAGLQDAPADQRASFMESIDAGFFPPGIRQGVKARLSAR